MLCAATTLLAVAAVAPCIAAQEADTKAQRTALAAHAIGINFAFMEVCFRRFFALRG